RNHFEIQLFMRATGDRDDPGSLSRPIIGRQAGLIEGDIIMAGRNRAHLVFSFLIGHGFELSDSYRHSLNRLSGLVYDGAGNLAAALGGGALQPCAEHHENAAVKSLVLRLLEVGKGTVVDREREVPTQRVKQA